MPRATRARAEEVTAQAHKDAKGGYWQSSAEWDALPASEKTWLLVRQCNRIHSKENKNDRRYIDYCTNLGKQYGAGDEECDKEHLGFDCVVIGRCIFAPYWTQQVQDTASRSNSRPPRQFS